MYLYGVCISDMNATNEVKCIDLLKELAEADFPDHYENFLEDLKANGTLYSFSDWIDNFEYEGEYGLAAFLCETIEYIEGVNIRAVESEGIHYVGLEADGPWAFNGKTKIMTKKDYKEMMEAYISKVTDEEMEVRWWHIESR